MVFPYWLFTRPCAEYFKMLLLLSCPPHSLSNATAFKNASLLACWGAEDKSSHPAQEVHMNKTWIEGAGQVTNQTREILEPVLESGESSSAVHLQWEMMPSWDAGWSFHPDSNSPLEKKKKWLALPLFLLMFFFHLFTPFQFGNDCKSLLATESAVFDKQWFDSCNLISFIQ